jgi:hypothetical protein
MEPFWWCADRTVKPPGLGLAAAPHVAQVHQARRDTETSLMAKGIFGYTAGESLDRSGG